MVSVLRLHLIRYGSKVEQVPLVLADVVKAYPVGILGCVKHTAIGVDVGQPQVPCTHLAHGMSQSAPCSCTKGKQLLPFLCSPRRRVVYPLVTCNAFSRFFERGKRVVYLLDLGKHILVLRVCKSSIHSRGVVGVYRTARTSRHISPRKVNSFRIQFLTTLGKPCSQHPALLTQPILTVLQLIACIVHTVLLQVGFCTVVKLVAALRDESLLFLASFGIELLPTHHLVVLPELYAAAFLSEFHLWHLQPGVGTHIVHAVLSALKPGLCLCKHLARFAQHLLLVSLRQRCASLTRFLCRSCRRRWLLYRLLWCRRFRLTVGRYSRFGSSNKAKLFVETVKRAIVIVFARSVIQSFTLTRVLYVLAELLVCTHVVIFRQGIV